MADKTRLQSIQLALGNLEEKISSIEKHVKKINGIEISNSKLERSMNDINESIIILKENIIQNLMDENKRLNEKIKVVETEKNVAKVDQYDRRNNTEFHGIPDDIQQDKLEEKVIEICVAIGADIEEKNIEACHRFGRNKPQKVIARLVNRKDIEKIKENKKKLKKMDMSNFGFDKKTKIFIQDNLSPYYSELAWKCRKLKKSQMIYDWWYRNEILFLKRTENENPKLVCHPNDIEALYPNFDYSG